MIRKILEFSDAYQSFFSLVGGYNVYKTLVKTYIPQNEKINVLDIGCGPAHFLPWLVNAQYTGIDISGRYIDSARKKYINKGLFICGDVNVVEVSTAPYDFVFAVGLLHHLSDDEVVRLAKRVRQLLRPNGKFITVDGCYIEPQSSIAKFILSNDRGEHVRKFSDYITLVEPQFGAVKTSVRHDLLRIPYTHLIMECSA